MTAKVFSKITRDILSMSIKEFIDKYKDLLPSYGVVTEDDSIEKVLELVRENKHYIIVVDKHGKLRGIVTYLDILLALGGPKPTAAFLPFSSIASALRKVKLSSEVLPKVLVKRIMERTPHHIGLEDTVEEAIDMMEKYHIHHLIVVDKKGTAKGIVTAHAIFRAVVKEIESEKIKKS